MTHEDETLSQVRELIDTEPVVEVFGRPAAVKIMVIMVDAMGGPLPVSDIAEQADVSRKSVYNNSDALVEYGLLEQPDSAQFRAPMDAEPVQAFIHLYDALLDEA